MESCCHLNSSEKPLANADVKNSQKSKIAIIRFGRKGDLGIVLEI